MPEDPGAPEANPTLKKSACLTDQTDVRWGPELCHSGHRVKASVPPASTRPPPPAGLGRRSSCFRPDTLAHRLAAHPPIC